MFFSADPNYPQYPEKPKKEISTDTIESFLFEQLIKEGLVPSEKELEILSDIFFDFLTSLEVIDELEEK